MCCLSKRPWNTLQSQSSKLFYSIDHAIVRCSRRGAIFMSMRADWGCLKSFAFSLHSPISQEFSKPFSFPTERSMPRYRFQKSLRLRSSVRLRRLFHQQHKVFLKHSFAWVYGFKILIKQTLTCTRACPHQNDVLFQLLGLNEHFDNVCQNTAQ